MNEHDYALRDAHMADAVGTYFKARPQLMRTIHEERIYEAGFKAAWDRLQSALSEATARAERAEVELKAAREPIATVYIGSGHCKVAFTDAAKEAMKGRQGQSFDVYAEPMPRAVKESLTAESTAAQVPQGASFIPDIKTVLESVEGLLSNTTCSSGVCMCGDGMACHSSAFTCGHSPCDSGEYHQNNVLTMVSAILERLKP